MRICVLEDNAVARLHPLTLTRPAFDLRCGAVSLLGRQLRALPPGEVGAVVRPEIVPGCHLIYPSMPVNDLEWLADAGRDDLLLVNARWLSPAAVDLTGRPEVGLVQGQVAYAALPAGFTPTPNWDTHPDTLADRLERLGRELPAREVGGAFIEHPWDLVEHNASALLDDFQDWRTLRDGADVPTHPGQAGVAVLGSVHRLAIDPEAVIEPLACLDTTRGPILLDRGAVVRAFSRIDGPCYVGPGTQVQRAHVQGSSIGPHCRIGGEVESAIVHGYTNKAHEGFLGHSYVGEWVNLGAGTHTSDLRNDYQRVTMHTAEGRIDTGLLKVGAFLGDHTKTSIGTLFNTGSIVGPFCQLVTSGSLLPRYLSAFCQHSGGRLQERTDLGRIFATAATAMARRQQEWTDAHVEFFLALYEQTAADRQRLFDDGERRRPGRAGWALA